MTRLRSVVHRGEFIRPSSPVWPVARGTATSREIYRFLAFYRGAFGRAALPASTPKFGAALSSVVTAGCASHGALLFLVWPRKSNQKEGHPCIRVLLRKTSLPPAPLRGASRRAIPGPSLLARRPCLASPYATPTLGLVKGTRDRGVWKFFSSDSNKAPSSFEDEQAVRRRRTPLSGGRMESARRGASGMDAARGVKGHGWPLYAAPRSADGMREVSRSETRMQGQDLLVPLGGVGHPATAKRDSPSRAKPMPQPTQPMGITQRTQRQSQGQKTSQARTRRAPRGYKSISQILRPASHPVAPRRDSNEKRPLVCA